MKRTVSGLWIAPTGVNFLRFRKRERTVTLPNGERAKVTIDDSGTVKQTEHGEHLDALVMPAPIHVRFEMTHAIPALGGFAKPQPIRTGFKQRRAR